LTEIDGRIFWHKDIAGISFSTIPIINKKEQREVKEIIMLGSVEGKMIAFL
jgi:hypothetical protein